jgi:UDP-N-acetylmuramate dehydrogenase
MSSGDVTLAALEQELTGTGVTVVPRAALDQLTTLRVGGPAGLLVTVEDEQALVAVTAATARRAVPLLVLGRGSNLLVQDEGWPGVVLRLGSGFRGTVVDGTTVRAGAAEPMPSVAVHTARLGLTGFAWGAAVPGTMGGGVRMNAGAHGADMAASLVSARVLDGRSGAVEEWEAGRLELRYRHSALEPHHVVVSVELVLEPDDPVRVMAEIDAIRTWRREHQPLNRPSCGSVFTNPPGRSAGALIEEAGLKGVRIGGAEVSETHANFIVTSEGACAADVAALIDLVAERVHEHAGIELRAEVVRAGVPPTTDVA